MSQFFEIPELKVVGNVRLPARAKPFNAEKFYNKHEGDGVYVWNSFQPRVLDGYQAPETTPERFYMATEAVDDVYDTDILAGVPSCFCIATLEDLATLVEILQAGGEETYLLMDGQANGFYVKGSEGETLTLSLYWNTRRPAKKSPRLTVRATRITEGSYWLPGSRIFFPRPNSPA